MSWGGILLLACLLVVLPWLAWRSALQLRAARSGTEAPGTPPLPSRSGIFIGTLILLSSLFLLAWLTGRTFGFDPFHIERLGTRELLAGLAALAGAFGLRWVSEAIRSESERRNLPAFALMPRTSTEWGLYLATAVSAGIAEETAYRGVGMALLTWSTGSPVLSAAVLSVAFGLAHLTQEWKSVAIVIAMALLMHGLVAFTGTLVIAMVVHTVYDVIAGILGSRDARRFATSSS
jgi:membrane protease YdiL (CAAX protease family)